MAIDNKTIIKPSYTKAQGEVAARLLLSDALMAGGKLQEARSTERMAGEDFRKI